MKAEPIAFSTVTEIVAMLKPGQTYSLRELHELTGVKISHVRGLLDEAKAKRLLCESIVRRRGAWTLPPNSIQGQAVCTPPVRAELKGYDKQLQTFRTLCEASRSH